MAKKIKRSSLTLRAFASEMQKKFYFASSHTTLSILPTHRFRMGLYFKEQEFKSSIEAMHICPRNKWRSVDSLKLDNCSSNNLSIKVSTDSSTAVSIENYRIKILRSDFQPMLMYLCRVSFLTNLDIYKAYFKGRHIREYKQNTYK